MIRELGDSNLEEGDSGTVRLIAVTRWQKNPLFIISDQFVPFCFLNHHVWGVLPVVSQITLPFPSS